jgi:hypothetical protein
VILFGKIMLAWGIVDVIVLLLLFMYGPNSGKSVR